MAEICHLKSTLMISGYLILKHLGQLLHIVMVLQGQVALTVIVCGPSCSLPLPALWKCDGLCSGHWSMTANTQSVGILPVLLWGTGWDQLTLRLIHLCLLRFCCWGSRAISERRCKDMEWFAMKDRTITGHMRILILLILWYTLAFVFIGWV